MTKKIACLGLLLLGVPIAVQGCGTLASPQVAAPTSRLGVSLLDAGAEPRSLLRYAIEEGTTTKATMTVRVRSTGDEVPNRYLSGLRSVELDVVYGPAEPEGNRIKYPLQIGGAKAVSEPNASRATKKKLEEQAALLRGAGAVVEIDDRGHLRGSEMNAVAAQVPVRVLWDLLMTLASVSEVWLPDEPVGLGARWEYRGMIAVYGLRIEQAITYTLSERVNDKPVLEIEYEQIGGDQVVSVPGSAAPIDVVSARMTATGRAVLDLTSLVSSGSVSGLVRDVLVVSEDGKEKSALVEEVFEVQVRTAP
ncbi:MAG: hypothetical protein KJN97_12590 [Deltaproteobacteria bacterium]|nr:hypothetical protein [Deltaproteobacteria bacterium]